MALADIVINDGQGSPVAHTFAYVSSDSAGRVIRKDMSRTPDLPLTLTIGHQKSKVAGVSVDSHLVKVDDSIMDSDGITVRRASIRVIIDCDPNIYTDGEADNLAAYMRNYFSSANCRLLMKGSVG